MTNKLPATATAAQVNAPTAHVTYTVTPLPNHSVVSYGHGSNDSFVHPVSGRRLHRTVAVEIHRSEAAPAPQNLAQLK